MRAAREGSDPSAVVYGAVQVLGYVLVIGAPVAYAAALAGGLPIYLLLRRARRLGRAPPWTAGELCWRLHPKAGDAGR